MGETLPQILIVDDDSALRHLVSSLLSLKPWEITEAGTLGTARELLRNQPFDVVLLDHRLPDGVGFELVEELNHRAPHTKVVFISAFLESEALLERLSDSPGVACILSKPLASDQLLEHLERIVALTAEDGTEATLPLPRVGPGLVRDEVEARIAAMRSDYARRLATRLERLGDLVTASTQGEGARTQIKEALDIAHKIAGTAGSYGFRQVSDAITVLENVLVDVLEGTWSADESGLCELARAQVDQARRHLAQARHRLGDDPPTLSLVPETQRESRLPVDDGPPNGTVLLVSQDPDLAENMAQLAAENLMRVLWATDGEAALLLAREHALRAAFVDVPADASEQSYCVAQRLRALGGLEALPLAFVTSGEDLLNRVAAAHAGASLILTRPFDARQFDEAFRLLADLRMASRPTILILDSDEENGRRLVAALRRQGLAADALSTPTEVRRALQETQPDLLLAEIDLPEIGGLEICRLLRATPEWRDLAIVLTTTHSGVEMLRTAYKAGADDFIAKPFEVEELLVRTGPRLERIELRHKQTERDVTTGLPLRRAFTTTLERVLAEPGQGSPHRRRTERLSLALLDIDYFKVINDEHGQAVADRVLAHLGKLLACRFRTDDVRCRWGGDQLALALLGENPAGAAQLIERLLAEFRQLRFTDDHGEPFHATFSAGICGFPFDASSLERLIQATEERLAVAKASGRNCVVFDSAL
jgi:diguanylate cyclase (GGDEF)-like protein